MLQKSSGELNTKLMSKTQTFSVKVGAAGTSSAAVALGNINNYEGFNIESVFFEIGYTANWNNLIINIGSNNYQVVATNISNKEINTTVKAYVSYLKN